MNITKRTGILEKFNKRKVEDAISSAFNACGQPIDEETLNEIVSSLEIWEGINVEEIQDQIIELIRDFGFEEEANEYAFYRWEHEKARNLVESKKQFIQKYKEASNTANATIDDNSNVSCKNIGVLNAEGHKPENILVSRGMVTDKLKELYPNFDSKQYIKDLKHHIIYKHDESSFIGAIAPYCCSISMFPFLQNGIKGLGGLSAKPQNLDSFCGMYINLIFAVSGQFAGAVATSEFLLYFDYFARKEWGDDYYSHPDLVISQNSLREKTIRKQIHQYFQQVVYSINQPAASRGMQSSFTNISYFDKPFFEAMFGNFYFPDFTQPKWDSLNWLQKEFMQWFNAERLKCIITFPVESFALIYQDGHFLDQENADFVAEEYARGHSFFTYISDTADSLSSCCRLKNKVTTKEFNFTNGNLGIETGSKSVISLNLNRIIQDYLILDGLASKEDAQAIWKEAYNDNKDIQQEFSYFLKDILQRVYKYHIAYNELLWDMYDACLLPAYSAGFINLDKQYLTIGINGLNQAAEYVGISCNDNKEYQDFCQLVFSTIKDSNNAANGTYFGHKVTFNTECVPKRSGHVKSLLIDSKLL